MLVNTMRAAGINSRGVVQGTGIRPFAYRLAHQHELNGRVHTAGSASRFISGIESKAQPLARMDVSPFAGYSGKLAFITKSDMVSHVFFPRDDIRRPAICSTVNDLAISRTELLYLNLDFIIVEAPRGELEQAIEPVEPAAQAACVIGEVQAGNPGRVAMKTPIGSSRIVDMLTGDPLPRIC